MSVSVLFCFSVTLGSIRILFSGGGLGHDRFGIPPIRLVLLRHLSQLKCIPRGTWHSPCGEVIMEEIQGFTDLLL